jgi:ABC-2 type transport system ATP-binding protein
VLVDFLRPTSGQARVLGLDPRRDCLAIRSRVGSVPREIGRYQRITGRELLGSFGRLGVAVVVSHGPGRGYEDALVWSF